MGVGHLGQFVSNSACFLVLCAAWFCALLGGGCCLGLRLLLPGCPAGSWRLLAAGGCWRPLMAVRLLMVIGQIGHFLSNTACCLVPCAAWFCALLGGGCCLGFRLPLPGCPAGSWRLLAAGGCWRPLMAVRLLMGVVQLDFRVNIFFSH